MAVLGLCHTCRHVHMYICTGRNINVSKVLWILLLIIQPSKYVSNLLQWLKLDYQYTQTQSPKVLRHC